jgi:hypothetical protein
MNSTTLENEGIRQASPLDRREQIERLNDYRTD